MTNRRSIKLIGMAGIAVLAGLGLAGCGGRDNAPLEASGFIEADEVSIVAETSGLVIEVLADEGDTVEADQELLHLDDSLLLTQRAEAEAAVAATHADRDEEIGGPRPEALAQAEARLAAAEAEQEGAQMSLERAQAAVEDPHEIYAQFASVNAAAQVAAQEVELAEAQLDETQFWLDATVLEIDVDENQQQLNQAAVRAAEANLEAAKARQSGLSWQAGLLYGMVEQPLALIAEMHQTEARLAMAEANAVAAQAEVYMLVEGPTAAERDLLDAQVRFAEAQLMLVEALIDQLTLTAPFEGVVTSRSVQVGETVLPNVPLMTVANLDSLKLVVYIPETQIGRVQPGQEVDVRVDAYPLRTFEGEVSHIAREAEFTPRNIQTEEERVNLVFAVEIDIPNPEGRLKPGMPADATIQSD